MRLLMGLILAGCAATAITPALAWQMPTAAQLDEIVSDAKNAAQEGIPDLPGTGPYPATKEQMEGLPGHVVYRPADLSAMGDLKLGVVVWGNGGCRNDAASARLHLLELASHGYLVIAPGGIHSGPGAQPPSNERVDDMPAGKTSTQQILRGLDWALAENRRAGSSLFGRIDEQAVAASGRSCGGLQALQAAADPRIATAVIHNSGTFAGLGEPVEGVFIGKDDLRKLHSPVLYILGGPADAAYPNGTDDFARIDHVPVMLVDISTGHGGTYREPFGGRTAQIEVDWLDWQLRGDATAGRSFLGPSCRLCLQPDLRVQKKKIDQEPAVG